MVFILFFSLERSVIISNLKLPGDLLAESDQDETRSSSVEQQNINNTQAGGR